MEAPETKEGKSESRRQTSYQVLSIRFRRVEQELSEEMKTELDGLLWDLSAEIWK